MTTQMAQNMRSAMRGLAASVTVISTVDKSGQKYAITATSPTSLSFDPLSMVICVNRETPFYTAMAQGNDFVVNILPTQLIKIAQICGGSVGQSERFMSGDWRYTPLGLPYLFDAQSMVFCKLEKCISYGTHDIIIGRVYDVQLNAKISPLVYAEGAYQMLVPLELA
jgi:flavin reductase (DIM6/NTAB) family NADH-FMN oxidoreductase RutF